MAGNHCTAEKIQNIALWIEWRSTPSLFIGRSPRTSENDLLEMWLRWGCLEARTQSQDDRCPHVKGKWDTGRCRQRDRCDLHTDKIPLGVMCHIWGTNRIGRIRGGNNVFPRACRSVSSQHLDLRLRDWWQFSQLVAGHKPQGPPVSTFQCWDCKHRLFNPRVLGIEF